MLKVLVPVSDRDSRRLRWPQQQTADGGYSAVKPLESQGDTCTRALGN